MQFLVGLLRTGCPGTLLVLADLDDVNFDRKLYLLREQSLAIRLVFVMIIELSYRFEVCFRYLESR